jgi:poly(hydroxyalkanoate) granule-associated protein
LDVRATGLKKAERAKGQTMARTSPRKAKAAKRAAPAAALRNLTLAARKALVAGIDTTRKLALARADEARTRTAGAVSHLEKVFEARVGAAINRLGVPSARDVRALSRQVAELQASVERLKRTRARASA